MKRREQNEAQEAWAERSKERRKWQAELQEQERLLKLQKLNEPGVPLADFASDIVEIESLNTSEVKQVQEDISHGSRRTLHVLIFPTCHACPANNYFLSKAVNFFSGHFL